MKWDLSSVGGLSSDARPLPGIETLQIQRCWLSGRGVVLAMRSRMGKLRNWWWLMERLGL